MAQDTSGSWAVVKDLMAGTIGGWAQVFAAQPFDTVKPQGAPIYSSAMDCVKKTAAEGMGAFYKGTASPLIGVGFMVSIQFGVLEAAKRALVQRKLAAGDKPDLSLFEIAMCGGLGGITSGIVSSPVEHIRIRLQLQSGAKPATAAASAVAGSAPSGTRGMCTAATQAAYTGSVDAFKRIYAQHGLRGLYQGASATFLREGLGYAGYFASYEACKRHFSAAIGGDHHLGMPHYLVAGSIAGFGMWVPAYPLDIIKSKMQADALSGTRRYPTMLAAAKRIMAEEGAAGFFKGFAPCFARAAPANSVTFLMYEVAIKYLSKFD